jgi:hypothetical protein
VKYVRTTATTRELTVRVCPRCGRIIKAGDIHGASYCTVRELDGRLYQYRWPHEAGVPCGDDQRGRCP